MFLLAKKKYKKKNKKVSENKEKRKEIGVERRREGREGEKDLMKVS